MRQAAAQPEVRGAGIQSAKRLEGPWGEVGWGLRGWAPDPYGQFAFPLATLSHTHTLCVYGVLQKQLKPPVN